MNRRQLLPLIELSLEEEMKLIEAARDFNPVRGLTHRFYKYPARFSPTFVRAIVETFTRPADLVVDNHVGGGTTLVEALALGRHAIGVDISTLAAFVSIAKSTVFTKDELHRLSQWCGRLPGAVNIHRDATRMSKYAELGYYRHLTHPMRWRLRKAIEQCLAFAIELDSERLERFARCVVLRTAQWALDGRKKLPSIAEFREQLAENAKEMIEGAAAFRAAVLLYPSPPSVCVLNRSSAGIEADNRILKYSAPKLVLTSPPYPGVHVLYHRWQVDGRKEAPLPFMIANKLDGAGSSHYTMGDRKRRDLKTYFDSVRETMSSIAALSESNTMVVQVLAFSDPSWQLPRYLEAMRDAGLTEVHLPSLARLDDGRLWRHVPSRRWYSEQRGRTPASREVVLFHRKSVRIAQEIRQPLEVSSVVSGTTVR